jgi:hypothetical protein
VLIYHGESKVDCSVVPTGVGIVGSRLLHVLIFVLTHY